MRPAGPRDAKAVFELSNDPEVRRNSINSKPICWEGHLAWFGARIADASCLFFVFEDASGRFAAQARVEDRGGSHPEISLSIRREFRGMGLASEIIRMATAACPAKIVRAVVKESNKPSARAFERAGYRPAGTAAFGGETCLLFEHEK